MPRPFHIEIVDLSRLGPASVAVGRSFQRRWQLAAQGGRGSFFGSVIAFDFAVFRETRPQPSLPLVRWLSRKDVD